MNISVLKKDFGISAKKVISLRSNVAVVVSESNEKAIIKQIRKSKSSNWLNKHRFLNELRIYKVISQHQYQYLNAPKLIDFSNQHMILQYVERDEITRPKRADFLHAYYEMQTLKIPKNFWFDLKNKLIRGFLYKATVVPIVTLKKHLGRSTVLRMIMLYVKLELKNKKLKNRYWLHGDLTTHNVYYNPSDTKLYFLDYENFLPTRKWPLTEIIQKCFWLKEGGYDFHVDTIYLKSYLNIIKKSFPELNQISFKDHFRFTILMSCINNISTSKSHIKRNSYKILLGVTLDDEKFDNWYQTHIKNNLP